MEIDSIVPDKPEFEFLKDRKFRVKTIKLRGQISQGLVLPLSYLPKGNYNINDDVTDIMGIVKYEPNIDNINDNIALKSKKKTWKQYVPKKVINFMFKYLPDTTIKIFGCMLSYDFPSFVDKTDEIRVQNLNDLIESIAGQLVVGTEKIDGSSETIYLNNGRFGVCSRNTEIPKCNEGKYWYVVNKYDIENKMRKYFGNRNITLQGELHGQGIQGNKYKIIDDYDIRFFDVFDNDKQEYLSTYEAEKVINDMGLKFVPIIYRDLKLPNDIKEILKLSEGKSVINNSNIEREGIVWRLSYPETSKRGQRISFKAISNKFLLKNND